MMYGSSLNFKVVRAWLLCRIHCFTPFGPDHQCLSFVVMVKISPFSVLFHRFCYWVLIDMLAHPSWLLSIGGVKWQGTT